MPDYNLIEKFVINLERRPDRLNKFLDKCPLNDVKVISAFDGQNPEKESSDTRGSNVRGICIFQSGAY